MNLDHLLLRAARTPDTELEQVHARRVIERIKLRYAAAVEAGIDVTAGLDLTDPLHADASVTAQIARAAHLANLGRFTWYEASDEMRWSDEVWTMLGYPPGPAETSKEIFLRHVHRDDRDVACRSLREAWAQRTVQRCTFRMLRRDHSVLDVDCHLEVLVDEHDQVSGIIGTVQDVTARERARREVERLKRRYDTVRTALVDWDSDSGLFTRRRFADELDRALRFGSGAVLVVRIEALESPTYDLVRVAARFLESLKEPGDQLGRVGPNEIGVLLAGATWTRARRVTEYLVEAVRAQHFITADGRIRARAWGGLVRYPKESQASSHDLLIDAESAWRKAKAVDRVFISHSQPATPQDRQSNYRDRIAAALRMDRFTLFAQPILELESNDVNRYELLLRVLDENDIPQPPSAILDTAERLDAVFEIDLWVLERAMQLLTEVDPELQLQVNVSGRSLGDARLIAEVERMMERYRFGAEQLTFEITETAIIGNLTEARRFADRIHELGCQLALDDFGSGHSSFRYLKLFPIDLVKIDGEFIDNLVDSPQDQVVVRALVQVCQAYGVQTLAECVEDDATLRGLREMGVELAQGYLIGEPRPGQSLVQPLPTGRRGCA
jgi:EAL domain-containing protein (putative c-di-GMP-specific phosphodiesterase class I)/GGDEF domain-containing protein/PAS domain-containing protein